MTTAYSTRSYKLELSLFILFWHFFYEASPNVIYIYSAFSPICPIPISLAMITNLTKSLEIVDIKPQIPEEPQRLDVIDVNTDAVIRRCTAAQAATAMKLKGLHTKLAPLK